MKKSLLIIIVAILVLLAGVLCYAYFFKSRSICWPYCSGMSDEDREEIKEEMRKAGCPDEKIINRMPGSQSSSYYIKNGERREIFEYDDVWVQKYCVVPVQEVF